MKKEKINSSPYREVGLNANKMRVEGTKVHNDRGLFSRQGAPAWKHRFRLTYSGNLSSDMAQCLRCEKPRFIADGTDCTGRK